MDNLTTCEIIQASERASDMRKNFICAQDALHESMLNSPWPILVYVASVFFIMFLVQRAANVPGRVPEKDTPKKPPQKNTKTSGERKGRGKKDSG